MINLIGIKCKENIYITDYEPNSSWRSPYSSVEKLIINGEKVTPSFQEEWSVIDKKPETVQRYKPAERVNYRYVLKDKDMASDKIPPVFKEDEVIEDYEWKDEYDHLKSLYSREYDELPETLEDVEFEYKEIMKIKEIKEYPKFSYNYENDKCEMTTTPKSIGHQVIDKILYPNILLPSRPCSLSSTQSYDIVRKFVKENINPKAAHITSDYDFCFTVKKYIPLSKTKEYSVDVNNSWFNKRKRKTKYEKRYKTEREIICFKMSPSTYNNYTIISGFKGKDQGNLQNNIDDYCKNLIEFINDPIKDCPHCEGEGVISNGTFKINGEKK